MRGRFVDRMLMVVCGLSFTLLMLALVGLLYILSPGLKTITPSFLFSSIHEGGVLEPIVGTVYLFAGGAAIVAPIGTFTAVYMVEYAPKSLLTRLVDKTINNLAGVPSIIFGLFGFTFFCKFMGLGVSLLSGWLTMACMMLPIMVRSVEEVLRTVPESVREASLSLGATKWQTVRHVILPAVMPGILTGIVLSMARISGETAAILFTACFYTMRGLPRTVLDPVLTLTYYLFIHVVAEPGELDMPSLFGLALTLFMVTVTLCSAAFTLRAYFRRRWRI